MGEVDALKSNGPEFLKTAKDFIRQVRSEAMYIALTAGVVTELICLAGLMWWCPACGGWHGNAPPPAPEPEPMPPPNDVIRRIVAAETNVRPSPRAETWEGRGEVDGQPAQVRQRGDRVEALWDDSGNDKPNSYNHRHIVANDGLNADYVKDLYGRVVVDNNQDEPYMPYTQDTSGRYSFDDL